jgi:hypothetical protein
MSDPVPPQRQHRTDLGTKVKSDATLILVETDKGLTGMGAALGSPPVVCAIVEHELAPEVIGEDPLFSERIYEKMYNGSRAQPALERGVPQPETSRRSGMVMEAIAGIDIAVWDVKAQALGIPVYQALGAARSSVRAYASGGWAPGEEAEAELGGYAAKGFSAVKMRVVGRDGFSIEKCVRRVRAARRGIGSSLELMIDAHGSLEVASRSSSRSSSSLSTSRGSKSRCRRKTIADRRKSGVRRRFPSPPESVNSRATDFRASWITPPSTLHNPMWRAPAASPRSVELPPSPPRVTCVLRRTRGAAASCSRRVSTQPWRQRTVTSSK